MAKELMEIGGFITSGAEIVNHDNSLSGNGTVDSPLGVVPGYNETVLFDGSLTGTLPVSATLSEAPSAFEYVQVHMGGGYKSVYTYEGTSDTWQIFSPYVGGSNISLYAVNVSISNSNKTMTVQTNRSHYCKLGSGGITNYDSNKACTVGENTIKKVVGINRIANN